MRRIGTFSVLIAALLVALGVSSYAIANGGKKNLKADGLTGLQENPDISTVADVGLEGTVQQAHIHFGKRGINGGVTLFLCGTAASPGPAGTPACPTPGGTVSRTATAADILAPGTQGIEAGNYEELADALRSGHAYANVHSTKWPGGEIRAQINDRDAAN